jgi:hypothetical protein
MVERFMVIVGDLFFPRMAADFSAFARRCLVGFFAATGSTFLSSAGHFIDGRPCAPLGLLGTQTTRLVAFFDMIGLPFLFSGITGFITLWHNINFVGNRLAKIMPTESPLISLELF